MQRVISSAQEAFLSKGYERTSIDAIARASGVSKVTIYSYFPTKRALYAAAIQAGESADRGRDPMAQLNPSKPREALVRIGRQFLRFQRDDTTLSKHRTIYAEGAEQPEVARKFYENGPNRRIGEVGQFMKACREAGSLSVVDPDMAAEHFLCLFFGRPHVKAMLGLGKPSAAEDERLVQANVDFFLRAYQGR